MALTYSWNHPAAHKDTANLLCCINRQRALCKQHTFNDFQGWEFPTTELYAEVLQQMHLSGSISKQRKGKAARDLKDGEETEELESDEDRKGLTRNARLQ